MKAEEGGTPNPLPSVTTLVATSITVDWALLNGIVNPNELATATHFEYGTDDTQASPTLTTAQAIGTETTSVAVTVSLSGLIPGTQ